MRGSIEMIKMTIVTNDWIFSNLTKHKQIFTKGWKTQIDLFVRVSHFLFAVSSLTTLSPRTLIKPLPFKKQILCIDLSLNKWISNWECLNHFGWFNTTFGVNISWPSCLRRWESTSRLPLFNVSGYTIDIYVI